MGEWWNGSRANRKSSPGNSAQPIDFRARNDQYPLGAARGRGEALGDPRGVEPKVFIVSRETEEHARVLLRIGRPAGRPARVLAGRCVIVFPPRLRPLCFRPSSSIPRFSVSLSLSFLFVRRTLRDATLQADSVFSQPRVHRAGARSFAT